MTIRGENGSYIFAMLHNDDVKTIYGPEERHGLARSGPRLAATTTFAG